jgi:hypothetical protein
MLKSSNLVVRGTIVVIRILPKGVLIDAFLPPFDVLAPRFFCVFSYFFVFRTSSQREKKKETEWLSIISKDTPLTLHFVCFLFIEGSHGDYIQRSKLVMTEKRSSNKEAVYMTQSKSA